MNELQLKYGCNPNQKPSRIYMRTEMICLSLFCPADPATSTFWMLSTAGSWLKN